MATVTLEGLSKTYPGGFNAVKGVDLDVADGELVVIVGPSGCGKSTLLRMVAGLDMTVYRNMAYGLTNRRVPKDEIDTKVREVAETLELTDLLQRRPSQLSGGQRQRVAMGRAIVRSPKVFLFDEPLSNLDAKLRVQMRIEIRRLQRKLAVTSLYVTHDQVEAMTLADRLVAMNAGQVEQIGTPMQLYERPASLFVAQFIGAPPMNILPCVVRAGQAMFGEIALMPVPSPDGTPGGTPDGTQVSVGIRPEHVLVRDPLATPLRGVVELVERLGAETLAHVSIASERKLFTVIARVPEGKAPKDGEAVSLDAQHIRLTLFDAGGKRVQAT